MKTAKRKTITLSTLCMSLSFLLASLAGPTFALDKVPWAQLAYYLESRQVKLLDLATCDCPLAVNEEYPAHEVMQVIANTLYKWREYTFTKTSGESCLAVQMLQPENRYLTATEARTLLTASADWQNEIEIPDLDASPPAPPAVRQTLMPGNTTSRQNRTYEDPWELIGPDEITQKYSTVASLIYLYDSQSFIGTCFMVAPQCALTAGHNIEYHGKFSSLAAVAPAYFEIGDQSYQPFGNQQSNIMLVNSNFDSNDLSKPSEYNFGAIFFYHPFNRLATYMPLEFHQTGTPLTTTTVEVVGYPLYPLGIKSSTMWKAEVNARINAYNNSVIDLDPFSTGGTSGAPILADYGAAGLRAIGLVIWEDDGFNSGVLFSDRNRASIETLLSMEPPSYNFTHTYYIPYFLTGGSNWTGLALANHNENVNHLQIDFTNPDGQYIRSSYLDLSPNAQLAAPITNIEGQPTGWIRIMTTAPLYGLALIGNSEPSTMFDMDMQETLHKRILFPHLAADTFWDSTAMLCNPNDTPANLTFTYYDQDGNAEEPIISRIPVQGNITENLGELFGHPLQNGSIVLSSSQPLAAFLLYDGTKTGESNWKAGLSAVPLD